MNENIQQEFRELEPGEIFDQRYRIVQELGRGGMGIVYKAMDQKESSFLSWACAKLLKKQKYVAIKLIFGNHTSDEESLLRFKREVKRLSQTHHPYIVRFHDAHLESPPYYYTMEYVEGKTLESIIKTVRKNSFWVAETFEKIACALQHIHDKGIVHRDIKPGNIILLEQGQIPKLMDFGLAKSQETPSITATNEILGSPDYMSPEQIAHAQGQKMDQRSDIFSLGITLYEVLTGIRPFHHSETIHTLWNILHEVPKPPQMHYPMIPDKLQEICLKCLEKNPDHRYCTARELANDLKNFLKKERA